MRIAIRIILLFFVSILYSQDYCFFIPPKDWELAKPESLSPRVKVGFFGKAKNEISPRVNLATEAIEISLPEYVKAVVALHRADPNNRVRDLGKMKIPEGDAHLIEIDAKKEYGEVRLLQLMLVKNKTAYILTASAAKEEFSKFYPVFQSVFNSVAITKDLVEAVPQEEKRSALKNLYEKLTKDSEIAFQNSVINDYTEMGFYWQLLMLQSAQDKLGSL
jgi:hypothetical protein